jgi:hypothetical protein
VNDILRQTREGIEDEDSFQHPDTSRPLKSYLPKGVFSHATIELSSALTFLDPAKHSRSPSRLAGEAGIIGRSWARARQTSYVFFFFDKETELQRQTSYVVCLKNIFFNGGKSFTPIFFSHGQPTFYYCNGNTKSFTPPHSQHRGRKGSPSH